MTRPEHNEIDAPMPSRDLAAVLRVSGVQISSVFPRYAAWGMSAEAVLSILEAITAGRVTAAEIHARAIGAMDPAVPPGGCCLTCAQHVADYEESQRVWLENRARERYPKQYPFAVIGRRVHRSVCQSVLSHPRQQPGETLADFVHGPDQPPTVRRALTPDQFRMYLTSDEMHRWITQRIGPRGGAPKYHRCRVCQPALPERLSSEL